MSEEQGKLYEPTDQELADKVAAIKARRAAKQAVQDPAESPADAQNTTAQSGQADQELTEAQRIREEKRRRRVARKAAKQSDAAAEIPDQPELPENQPAQSHDDIVTVMLYALGFTILFVLIFALGIWTGMLIQERRTPSVVVEKLVYPDWYLEMQSDKIQAVESD